jgi:hypothetical protein
MGKKATRILGIVAAIAIPYLAPKIASVVFASSAINAAVANTLTGAVLGAGVAKATGGNVLLGAVGGGAGGYFGGGGGDLFGGGTSTASSMTGTQGFGAAADTLSGPGGYVTPTVTPMAAPMAAPMTAPVAATATSMGDISQGISYYGMEPTSVAGFGGTPPVFTPQAAGADLGAQLSTATAPAATTGGFTYDAFGSVVPAGGAAGGPVAGLQPGANLVSTLETLPTAAAAAPKTFTEALKQVPSEIANAYKDPKTLAQLTLQAVGALGSAALAGKGVSPEEQYLLDAQKEELEWLRENNPEAYEMRLREAQKLLGMSEQFDPEYFGLQSARAAQIRGARSKRAGLRGLTGQSRAVAERQLDIATGRETGTAYDVGAQRALQGRIQTQQAGLQLMPTPSGYTTSFGPLQTAYSAADARRRQAARDTSELFGSITGIPQSRSMG